MNQTRKDDKTVFNGFRPNRFFKQAGNWYYHTREGIDAGPFRTRLEAEKHLQTHVSIFANLEYQLKAIPAGVLGKGNLVKLQPIQMQWR
jgi:hypothetical protein